MGDADADAAGAAGAGDDAAAVAPAPAAHPAASKVRKRSWADIMATDASKVAREKLTKEPAAARKPRGAPRKGMVWDGKHRLVDGEYQGEWVQESHPLTARAHPSLISDK